MGPGARNASGPLASRSDLARRRRRRCRDRDLARAVTQDLERSAHAMGATFTAVAGDDFRAPLT